MCIYKKCPEQAHLQRRKQVRGARTWERASGVLCKESGPLVGAGGLKTRTPPPCGAPTALLAGKQPKGGDGVRGSLATPHPQGRAVWAPPREGGVVGIKPQSRREGEEESEAALPRKRHFLLVPLLVCAPSGQCPGSWPEECAWRTARLHLGR